MIPLHYLIEHNLFPRVEELLIHKQKLLRLCCLMEIKYIHWGVGRKFVNGGGKLGDK